MHLILALVLQLQAVGLEAGESFQQLAKMPTMLEHPVALQGRVLDAFTGRPLAGAKIETWSEEIDAVFGGYHRFGEARSGRDGRFTIRHSAGSTQAEKARISAPGYLTWSGVSGDLYSIVRIFPRAMQSPRLRILNLSGRPIAGARITSTYTCGHDVPAFDLHTGADGIATLGEYGLQDEVQQLRIRARGYQAIKHLDGEWLYARADAGRVHDIFLARQGPARFRVVDAGGDAISDLAIHINESEGYHVVRSNKLGLVSIASRYGSGKLGLQILGGPKPHYVASILPPVDRVPTLRRMAEEWPKETKTGTILVELPSPTHKQEEEAQENDTPPMHLFHEAGWWSEIYEEDEERVFTMPFPAGKGYLVVGGPFSGYEEEIHDFDLQRGKKLRIRPKLTLEPTIQVRAPVRGDWTLTIQAGEDSKPRIVFDEETHLTLTSPISVPGHRELTLYLQGEGRHIRKTFPMAQSGMKIDFAKELASLAPVVMSPLAKREIRFVSAKTGRPLAGKFSIYFGKDCQQSPAGDAVQDHFELRGPIGDAWLARFEADGHSPIFLRGRVAKDQPALIRKVEALATLQIKAPFEFKIEGDDALDLDALPPGPLGLVLLLENGRRYDLNLTLAPGAKRKIQIR